MNILSQDRKKIVSTDQYAIVVSRDSNFEHGEILATDCSGYSILGKYSNEAAAIEVLESVADYIARGRTNMFAMPNEARKESN